MKYRILVMMVSLFVGSLAPANTVDLKQSEFKWKAEKITGAGHHGEIKLKTATLETTDNKVKKGTLVIDMKSVTVTDLKGDNAKKFLGHILSGDFFEADKHPTAKFVIESDSGKAWKGKLTIKGKTQPITVKYNKKEGAYTGSLNFDRTKFGVIYGSGNFFKNLGDKVIKDRVQLDFTLKTK